MRRPTPVGIMSLMDPAPTHPLELAVVLSEYIITHYGKAFGENVGDAEKDIDQIVRFNEQP